MATCELTVTYVSRSIASSPVIFTRGSFPLRSEHSSAPPFRENFSASVDRVSPGFESMSGNYLSLLYRPPHRPPLDSQSGQAIRSSTELYKSLISRRVLIFDITNYLQEAHLSSTLDNGVEKRLQRVFFFFDKIYSILFLNYENRIKKKRMIILIL